jgi:outer membrane translocation and assembly module TamA
LKYTNQYVFILAKYAFLLFFVCSWKVSKAQDSIKSKKIKILPVPSIGYTPETKTYFGAVSLFTLDFYQDGITRTSNAKFEINYTLNNQLIIETGWNYFFRQEKWFTRGLIHFSKYPDLYYGVGANTSSSNELKFESNRAILDLDLLKQLWDNMFAGFGIRYSNYYHLGYYESNNPYPELNDDSMAGLKLILVQDSRNNILTPTHGSYIQIVNSYNISDDFYGVVALDLRKYLVPKYNKNHVLAGRIYTSLTLGDPPFFDYSLIGGDRFSRGYFYGRYRDQNFSTMQLEYRLKLFWRIGMATFGGISVINDDFSNINKQSWKPNGGLGLRFLIDKKENTNLRFDYAIGSGNQDGFYIAFGESF